MTDGRTSANPLFLREDDLRQGLELLILATRDLAADVDPVLAEAGLGRAHHRILYFVGRHPQITVTELLRILRITKQSLSRVLGELVQGGFVRQRPGTRDRRQRLLELTEQGQALERALWQVQSARIAQGYRRAGAEAVEGFRTVLQGMIAADRGTLPALTPAPRRRAEAAGR